MLPTFHVSRHAADREGHNTLNRRNVLRSTYGLDCLTIHARTKPRATFRDWIWHIFGEDLPGEVIDRLYDELRSRTFQDASSYDPASDPFPHPPIFLDPDLARFQRRSSGPFGGTRILGAYEQGNIFVALDLATAASVDQDQAVVLLAVLTEEFGHHVDHVLRNVYADRHRHPKLRTDAPLDEGAIFAMQVLPVDDKGIRGFEFAYDVDGRPIRIDDVPVKSEWGALFTEERIAADRRARGSDGSAMEAFAPGEEGHEGIERVR
jgi:hypothetical protein